jgi:hypothetical protein
MANPSSSDVELALRAGLAEFPESGHPLPDAVNALTSPYAALGCKKLLAMLQGLAYIFPEKATLAGWLALYEATVPGNPETELRIMRKWHTAMTEFPDGGLRPVSLYVATQNRDIETLLSSGVWLLDEIDARSMYFDPSLTAEDREEIALHFDGVNNCAQLMHALPTDMLASVERSVQSVDPSQTLTPESIVAVMQGAMGLGGDADGDGMERIIGWAGQMMNLTNTIGIEGLLRTSGEAAALQGTAMPDMSALMGAMSGLQSAAGAGVFDGMDPSGFSSIFASLGGMMQSMQQ